MSESWDFVDAHERIASAVQAWLDDPASKEPRVYHPYPYQVYLQQKIIDLPRLALFVDMGLGKTVVTLSAIHELKYRRWALRKALVIAPKKVAEDTWQTEAATWAHLQGLRMATVLGSGKERERALAQEADVYVINRENTQWLVDYYGHKWPFDCVVLDESTSFKNHQAKRFKALKAVSPRIRRLVELTGTPDPHGLMDLWAPLYLIDGGKRLGRTISTYREIFFVPDKRNATTIFSYKPKEGAFEAIQSAISDVCISMKAEDYLTLPELVYEDIPVVLDRDARRKYNQLEREAVLEVADDVITAATAAALSAKLQQLCNGAVYDEDRNVVPVHDCKVEALLETVERLHGQHAVVCYYFKHDLDRILPALERTGLRVRVYAGAQDKTDWNNGEIDLLLLNPASCGYGLNLQQGGHHIIWFSLTWNLEDYQQTNKRLHRQGQQYPVIVHHLIVKQGRDEDVIRSLSSKGDAQECLMQSLKARIDAIKEAC